MGRSPPVSFDELVAVAAPDDLRPAIDRLLAEKERMCEKDEAARIPEVDAFIADGLTRYGRIADELDAGGPHLWEPLEEVFLSILGLDDAE